MMGFHLNSQGKQTGYLFGGVLRVMNQSNSKEHEGEFFGKQKFLKTKYGLLVAFVPKTPKVGVVYPLVLILVGKLFVDNRGETKTSLL